ncbi:hypothetical protein [Brucella pituitosa]|uniref:Uncharacterized protein n=1 Tax=Brucella pituitosa TaxID=571256 RepID=A0A643EZ00_9HYPH|nr:hypothetical protein [Brucella pituitosa]KAB0571078.1 hypothetical protein F7Q93_14030 [Brucella pituitosa]
MTMGKIASLVKRHIWVWSLVLGFISFGGGFVASYYQQYRSTYLDGLRKNYEQFQESSQRIDDSLKLFSDVARGLKTKTPDEVEVLRNKLLRSVDSVRELSRRIDGTLSVAKNYERAVVRLADAADEITGPYDGKSLVEAVNEYYLAQQTVEAAVIKEDTKFLR